jgi:G3E family GTPase
MFDFERVATSAAWISKIENYHGEEDGDEDEHEHHHHHHHHDGHHCHDEHCHCHHHHHGEGEALEYGIGTFVYYRRRPMDLSRFDHFVARNWPRSIIRAKGICYFRGEKDTCYVFEQAGKQIQMHNAGQWYATMPEEELQMMLERDAGLRRDWDPEYGDRMQKIVFIGQNMDQEEIIRQLDECLV